jgi:hypothetical protein
MPIMSARWVVLLGSALLASGCSVTTELGKPCVLVKKPSEAEQEQGIRSKPVLEGEIATNQDFISFGSTDCEELICVRDAAFPRNTDPNAPATGYCSQPCVEGTSSCEVTDSEVSADLKSRMTCRSLIMDQATLDRLRAENPAQYEATFGRNNSPYFCAGKLPNLPQD